MPKFTEAEIEIRNIFIRLSCTAGAHLAAFIRIASVDEALTDREYYEVFCKITDIYYSSKKLAILTDDERSDLKHFKDILKVQAEAE